MPPPGCLAAMVLRTVFIIICATSLCTGQIPEPDESEAPAAQEPTGPVDPPVASSGATASLGATATATAAKEPTRPADPPAAASAFRTVATPAKEVRALSEDKGSFKTIPGIKTTYRVIKEGEPAHTVEAGDTLYGKLQGFVSGSDTPFYDTNNKSKPLHPIVWVSGEDERPRSPDLVQNMGRIPGFLQNGHVWPGLDMGTMGMKRYEIREFLMPADEVFGASGVPGQVPPASMYKWIVEISKIKLKGKHTKANRAARRLKEQEERELAQWTEEEKRTGITPPELKARRLKEQEAKGTVPKQATQETVAKKQENSFKKSEEM